MALFPDRRRYSDPLSLALPAEPIEIERARGPTLRGWRIPATSSAAVPSPESAPTAVFLPGNSGNLSSHALYIELLHRAGVNIVAVDYRGFGGSDGRPDLRALHDDALAACDAAREWLERDLGHGGELGLFGISIGANLALAVAEERDDIGAVAVEGLFLQREFVRGVTLDGLAGPRTVSEALLDGEALPVRDRFKFPGLRGPRPVAALWGYLGALTYPFSGTYAIDIAGRVRGTPLLAIHGTQDRLFPFEAAVEIQRAHGVGHLWLIPGVGHAQEPALMVDEEYVAQLESFFDKQLDRGASEPDTDAPEIDIRVEPQQGGGVEVELQLLHDVAEGEGAFLVTLAGRDCVHFHRPWLTAARSFRTTHPEEAPYVTALRMRCAQRRGEHWEPDLSPRARQFEAYGPILRNLTVALHARDVDTALDLLDGLADDDPPFPFDLIARLHSVRLEEVARRRSPEVARRASDLFRRFEPHEASKR